MRNKSSSKVVRAAIYAAVGRTNFSIFGDKRLGGLRRFKPYSARLTTKRQAQKALDNVVEALYRVGITVVDQDVLPLYYPSWVSESLLAKPYAYTFSVTVKDTR